MSNIENATAYLETLDINNKHVSQKYHDLSKLVSKSPQRSITVCATGEFTLPPDKVRLTLVIKSTKEVIEDAKQSVNRRSEYVIQTLKKNRIKESDITVNKTNSRHEKLYQVTYEISATFENFQLFEQMQNQFVEKLDPTVTLLQPKFFSTSLRTENIKRQASLQAMRNAKKNGFDMARSCNLALGKPISIIEETSQIREGIFLDKHSQHEAKSLTELIEEKNVSVIVSVKVTFELKSNKRN